ncbi:MAG: transglycosylase domain-containing protein [Polyangiaceae bacterium]|nr:transglycosylase domain-containing protein [Myxococcales bacterium]MCB9584080.1 transglycosylase domain-containing protein [Polyangiaceae bacterium]
MLRGLKQSLWGSENSGNRAWRWSVRCALLGLCAWLVVQRLNYPNERLAYTALESTRYVSSDGELLYEARSERGGYQRPVPLRDVSAYLVSATVSSEDRYFWSHPGVDPIAVARAAWLNLERGRVAFGGSTITQQLAGLIEARPRTFPGKAAEALDALGLELRLSKSEILEQYLNRAYYGRLAYGVEAAANQFFGKSAKDLTLDEAALLAVLPRAPSYYDPDKHPAHALERRRYVLGNMAARGWISRASAETAASQPLRIIPRGKFRHAPHALDYLAQHSSTAPREVKTSLDLQLQRTSVIRLRQHLSNLEADGATQGAVVVIENSTRRVLALVGSRDYEQRELAGAVNGALSPRPPGSTLKPFVYALALESGATPDSPVLDAPLHFDGYAPRSASGEHHGWVRLDQALGSSLNTPAVLVAQRVGARTLKRRLVDLDLIPEDTEPSLALALGGSSVRLLDLTNAYATLAQDGQHQTWTLLRADSGRPTRTVFSPRVARGVLAMLSDAKTRELEFGVETPLGSESSDQVLAGKTGTSQSFCDNWAVIVTPRFSVGVWIGNFDGEPLRGLLAMRGAAPLARAIALSLPAGSAPPWRRLPPSTPSAWSVLAGRPLLEQPSQGARFRMDPLLPRAALALELRATPRAGLRARFEVDGQRVEGDQYRASWPLTPGDHVARVELLDDEGHIVESSQDHDFHVEGT